MRIKPITLALLIAASGMHCAIESEPPMAASAPSQPAASLEPVKLFSLTVKEDGWDIIFTETERGENYSIARVDYKEGTSVGSSMLFVKCVYEIAKERGFEYFVNTYQSDDDSVMKIYFTNDDSVPLKDLVGDDYSAEVQEVYDDIGMGSVSMFKMMFEPQAVMDSMPEGGSDEQGLYRNAVEDGGESIVIREIDRGENYSTVEFGFRNEDDELEHVMFMMKCLCDIAKSHDSENVVSAILTPEGEYPYIWRMHFTDDAEPSIQALVAGHGFEYDAAILEELEVEPVTNYCVLERQAQN